MNARILATATLAFTFTAILPAKAADGQLLSLVMPGATVVAGINVEQAKGTQFGQYVLSLMQMQELKDFTAQTGFDPTRDVREVLVASAATPGAQTHATHSGLALARGTFDPARIQSIVVGKGG